jgi:hypothetical protein
MLSIAGPMLLMMFALGARASAAVASDPHSVKVSVAYADSDHHDSCTSIPSLWAGSPGVLFLGTGSPWDSAAIKLDNPSNQPLTVDSVTVDIGSATGVGPGYGPFVIPPRGTAILIQTRQFNFDSSDGCSPTGGASGVCYSLSGTYTAGTCASPSTAIPVVHVTVRRVSSGHAQLHR